MKDLKGKLKEAYKTAKAQSVPAAVGSSVAGAVVFATEFVKSLKTQPKQG